MVALRVLDNFVVDTNRSLSYSQMSTYDRCKFQYGYKYLKNLKPLARDQYIESWERMTRGTLIHAGGESKFLGEPIEKGIRETAAGIRADNVLSEEQKTLLDVMVEDSIIVATEAMEWFGAEDWEPIVYAGKPMVEAKLELPLPPWRGWVGYADLVAKHKPSGLTFVIDYKTRERFEGEGADRYNSQFPLYIYAVRSMGIECHGSLTFEIKPKPPKRAPRVVRDDTGLITGPRISTDGRFKTTPTQWSQTELEEHWADVQRRAKAMAALKPEYVFRSRGAFTCNGCQFEQLCSAEASGYDVADIIAENYSGIAGATLTVST